MVNIIYNENCIDTLKKIDDGSINCCVTSPPYFGLRDYGMADQIGLEDTPEEYVQKLVEIFREVRRALKDDGTLWLNLGDSYAGSMRGYGGGDRVSVKQGTSKGTIGLKPQKADNIGLKPKDLIGIPWMVAFALRADGWYLRQDIIWAKPNPMPESVKDRCTKSHEYIFLLTKSKKYYYDNDAIKEDAVTMENRPSGVERDREYQYDSKRNNNPKVYMVKSKPKGSFNGKTEAMADTGQNAFRAVVEKRNKRSVWTVTTKAYKEAHFATYPPELIAPCITAGCPKDGIVYDPFMGSGTTAEVAHRLGRHWAGSELNPDYCEIANARMSAMANQETFDF